MSNMAKFGKLPRRNYRENKHFQYLRGALRCGALAKDARKAPFFRFSVRYRAAPARPSVAFVPSLERSFIGRFSKIVNTGRGYVCAGRTPSQKLEPRRKNREIDGTRLPIGRRTETRATIGFQPSRVIFRGASCSRPRFIVGSATSRFLASILSHLCFRSENDAE